MRHLKKKKMLTILFRLKTFVAHNWDYFCGGGVGFSSSLLIIWQHMWQHVLESCICTIFVTLVGGIFAHYLRLLLAVTDRYAVKLFNKLFKK